MSLVIRDLASHRATAGAGVSATSYFLSQYRARTATAMKYAVVVIASITSSYQPAGAGAREVAPASPQWGCALTARVSGLIKAAAHRQNLHIDCVRQPVCAVFQDAFQDCAVKVRPTHIRIRKIGAFKKCTREIRTG